MEKQMNKNKEKIKGILAKRRINAKQIREMTDGLFSTLTDLVLYWLLLLPAASFGKSRSSLGVYKAFAEAETMMEEINYHCFKNALRKLKEKGLINSIKEWRSKQIATKEGWGRLKEVLPSYREKRFWDGNFYLIQYDIPENQRGIRNSLRDYFLKKLGAVLLQESSYLVFNNPQDLIQKFLEDKPHFEGNILISKLTKDGFLGEDDIKEFIWYKSGLYDVNNEYRNFIDKYKNKKDVSLAEVFKDYFFILQKDPQIPFELLPDEYLGDEVYLLFLRHFKNTPVRRRPSF
jgi:CRISPR-associated endonuclease Cas2